MCFVKLYYSTVQFIKVSSIGSVVKNTFLKLRYLYSFNIKKANVGREEDKKFEELWSKEKIDSIILKHIPIFKWYKCIFKYTSLYNEKSFQ